MRLSLSISDMSILIEAVSSYAHQIRMLDEDDERSAFSLAIAEEADRIRRHLIISVCKHKGIEL